MTDMPVSHRRERGVSIVMLTFLVAFVLIPMIGLAIDGAILFWMKAKLSAAVDAAALAAARSLNVGLDFPSQQDNAEKVGQQYFAANFPTGLMGAAVVNGQANIDVALDKVNPHVIRATVTAVDYCADLFHAHTAIRLEHCLGERPSVEARRKHYSGA